MISGWADTEVGPRDSCLNGIGLVVVVMAFGLLAAWIVANRGKGLTTGRHARAAPARRPNQQPDLRGSEADDTASTQVMRQASAQVEEDPVGRGGPAAQAA